ncbi:MAG: hypothetical protein WA628_16435 [Terriglobales bacterium]
MRTAAFLFALSLGTASVLPQASLVQHASPPAQPPMHFNDGRAAQNSGDGVQMLRRADILVVPVELTVANRAELASLRDRVAQAEMDMTKLDPWDPAAREQLSRQRQLMRALLSYAERQDTDKGKSLMALQVQRHLNRIEGQIMCEACHGGPARMNGTREQGKLVAH